MDIVGLRRAWSDWIGKFKPDLYVTITFTEEIAMELALKRFKQFFAYLNNRRFVFFEKLITCWVIFEKNDTRKGYHIHALIKGIDPTLAPRLEHLCHHAFGLSKVEGFDYSIQPYSAVNYIVDKHIYKYCGSLMYYEINSKYRKASKIAGRLKRQHPDIVDWINSH